MGNDDKKIKGKIQGFSLGSATTPDIKNVESNNEIIRKSSLASPTLPDPKSTSPSKETCSPAPGKAQPKTNEKSKSSANKESKK